MGVEYVKEGNVCERCKIHAGVNNQKLEHFKKYDIDELLCRDCRDYYKKSNQGIKSSKHKIWDSDVYVL